MNNVKPRKLPVMKILIGSILVAWWNKEKYSKALVLPTLLLVIIWALKTVFVEEIKEISIWLVLPFYLIGFSIFAVTCHRLILMDGLDSSISISLQNREMKFATIVAVLCIIYYLVLVVPLTVLTNIPVIPNFVKFGGTLYYITLISSIPAMYVLARLSMVLPSTAVDNNKKLKWSWEITRHNGWRIAIIVGVYPWLISTSIWLISREQASIIEQVFTAFLYYLGMAVGIFALSLAYKEIMSEPLEMTNEIQ